MVPKILAIFKLWFNEHSKEGKMTAKGVADFIHSCTNDFCQADDHRVVTLFHKYDPQSRGYITEKDFLDFYHESCLTRERTVW